MGPDTFADINRLMGSHPETAHGWQLLLKLAQPAAGANFARTVPSDAWEIPITLAYTLTCGAAAGTRSVAVTYVDGDGFAMCQVPGSYQVQAGQAVTGFLVEDSPTTAGLGPSTSAEGSVTSPAAGASIAATGTLPAGKYIVQGTITLAGTVAAADANNFALKLGATTIQTLVIPAVANTTVLFGPIEIDTAGSSAVSINAIALATTGAIYSADFTVTPDAGGTFYGRLPHLVLRSGWGLQVNVAGIQAADQLSGIGLFVARFPSDYASGQIADDRRHAERELLAELGGR